jgi:hypothetical protein
MSRLIRSSHLIHLGSDAIEQSITIVSRPVDIKVGAPRQKGKLPLAAQTIQRYLQAVGGSVEVES